jgi:hypothetical protein
MPLHQEDLHPYFTGMKASVKPLSWIATARAFSSPKQLSYVAARA